MSPKGHRAADPFRLAPALARALAGGIVRVGTQNRAKLAAVRSALAGLAEPGVDLVIQPADVASGVPDQPIGWAEIVAGARHRARAAFQAGDCELAVGIEDGLVRLWEGPAAEVRSASDAADRTDSGDVYNIGCAWITDGKREGHGFSSAFAYPAGCLDPAFRDQAPIGDLFDALWQENRHAQDPAASDDLKPAKTEPSGRSGGNIGLLTGGRLDRSDYGSQAVLCGLVRFLHTDLYV